MRSGVAALLLSCLAMAAPAQAQPRIERLEREMKTLVDAGQFSGMATVVWKDGRLVDRTGIGKRDLATGAPMRADTIVRIFSMTKPVTAVAMMILHDQGKWRPEDPISKYLPELADVKLFKGLDAAGQPILEAPATQPTMQQLMTYTAGFSYGFDQGWLDEQYRQAKLFNAASGDEFVARVARLPLAYQPGTKWVYSISVDLQGAIIERLSGMKLPEFMQKHIFDPLGMKDTGFFLPPEKAGRLATLYAWRDNALQPVDAASLPLVLNDQQRFVSAGGGLFSTADDYARFGRMLLGGGKLDGKRIISKAAARMMMSNHLPPDLLNGNFGIGYQRIRPGYQFGYDGVVVTDPAAAKVALGKGSYLWDGYASNWFWVDPEHDIVFVGIVQRVAALGGPPVQPISQQAIRDQFFPAGEKP
jgi:CubicO group peptidase (beta-lactamase class C family)